MSGSATEWSFCITLWAVNPFSIVTAHPRSEGAFCHAMVPAILGSVLDTCSGEDMKWCTQMLDILMSSKKDVCLVRTRDTDVIRSHDQHITIL